MDPIRLKTLEIEHLTFLLKNVVQKTHRRLGQYNSGEAKKVGGSISIVTSPIDTILLDFVHLNM